MSFSYSFIPMTGAFGVLVSGLPAFTHETNVVDYCPKPGTIPLFFISSAFAFGAGVSNTSLVVYSPISFSGKKHLNVSLPIPPSEALVSGFFNNFIILILMIFGPVAVVSWLQPNSYFLAILFLVGYSKVLIFFLHSPLTNLAHCHDCHVFLCFIHSTTLNFVIWTHSIAEYNIQSRIISVRNCNKRVQRNSPVNLTNAKGY